MRSDEYLIFMYNNRTHPPPWVTSFTKVPSKSYCLLREASVALREDKFAEREERLKKIEADRNRTSNIKAQAKEKVIF